MHYGSKLLMRLLFPIRDNSAGRSLLLVVRLWNTLSASWRIADNYTRYGVCWTRICVIDVATRCGTINSPGWANSSRTGQQQLSVCVCLLTGLPSRTFPTRTIPPPENTFPEQTPTFLGHITPRTISPGQIFPHPPENTLHD